jgi:two-component system NtrC family sensor kinase
MKIVLKIILFLFFPLVIIGQVNSPDSLRKICISAKNDSMIYKAVVHLYDYYEELNRDSAFFYANQCMQISHRNSKKLNEAYFLTRKAYQELNSGQFAEALQSLLASFVISDNKENEKSFWNIGTFVTEKEKRLYALTCAHHIYGLLMRETLNSEQEIIHFNEAKKLAVQINSGARSQLASLNLGRVYLQTGKDIDSVLYHLNEAAAIAENMRWRKYYSTTLYYSGLAYFSKGDSVLGLHTLHQSIESAIKENNLDALTRGNHKLANYYLAKKQKDSAIYYATKSLEAMKQLGAVAQIEYHLGNAYEGLYHAYELNNQSDSAYKYLVLAETVNDSINQRRIKSLAEFQKLTLNEQQRLQNVEKEKTAYENKIKTWFLAAGIGVLLLLAIIFYRNNRQKHKAKIKIETAYHDLKATQQQLIQSEKMASLGELTAGIAHEIQNPLNFVNNFSEVNKELADELKAELAAGNMQLAIEIADDIKDNSEKINHHGKRADGIVKGMLQHSRSSTGQKEPTDINALCDEYLRLAYHGLRAKDKSFNATMKTDFDERVGNINIVPHDIGRVILNLINNAFYAVSEKTLSAVITPTTVKYEPTVSVRTKKVGAKVLITVKDNGNGIPQKVLDKIFQPFFTTKPTGQGTGLGLSLSYDIVKAHGGELKVETKEGEGSEFIIQLQTN